MSEFNRRFETRLTEYLDDEFQAISDQLNETRSNLARALFTELINNRELMLSIYSKNRHTEDILASVDLTEYISIFDRVDGLLPKAVWNGNEWEVHNATKSQEKKIRKQIAENEIIGDLNGICALCRKSNEGQSTSAPIKAYAKMRLEVLYFAVFGKNSGFRANSLTKCLKDMWDNEYYFLTVQNSERGGVATATRNLLELIWSFHFCSSRDIETDLGGCDIRSRDGFLIAMLQVLLQAQDQFLSNANTKESKKHHKWIEWLSDKRANIDKIEKDLELVALIQKNGSHEKTLKFLSVRTNRDFDDIVSEINH